MKRYKGFTLVESLISIFLLVFALMAIMNVFTCTRSGVQLSENRINAAFWGNSLLNDMASAGFDNIKTSSGTYDFAGTDNGAPFLQKVSYTINVTDVNADMKQVWITLTWQEHSGSKRVVLESLFTNL